MEMVFSSNSSFYTVFGPFYIFIVQEYTILRDLDLVFYDFVDHVNVFIENAFSIFVQIVFLFLIDKT